MRFDSATGVGLALVSCALAHADVNGLQVEYNGVVEGRHVWSVYALSSNPGNVMLAVIGHQVTAGSMSGVQHNNIGSVTWDPSATIGAAQRANDSFVTITGLTGSSARTTLSPEFTPGTVIPNGAGWQASTLEPPILFTGGRIKIMQVAGATYSNTGSDASYSGRVTVGYRPSSASSVPVYAENLAYTIGCSRAETQSSPQLVPFSSSQPREWAVEGIKPNSAGAQLTLTARARLGSGVGFLTVKADGVTIATNVFGTGTPCPKSASVATLQISPAQFSALTADGRLVVRIEPSSGATSAGCSFAELHARLDYIRDAVDCDANGGDDVCQIRVAPSQIDCNMNGVIDSCDIASGTSADANANGRPDECEELPCVAADVDGDGDVGGADLTAVLAAWGPCAGSACEPDIDGNGAVDGFDLSALLAAWGPCGAP